MKTHQISGITQHTVVVIRLEHWANGQRKKPDDGYYHLLAPARLVADEGLRFYRYPLHSGVVSQMGYQLGAAPVHAMGVPQAWAVVGVGFWLSLVWFGIRQAQESGAGRAWSSIVALGLAAGLYPTAWYATAGAHAMGDVTFAAGVLLAARIPAPSLQGFAQLNLLLVAAACTKVSLLPMLLVTWLFALAQTWAGLPRQKRLRLVLIALAPWLLWQGTGPGAISSSATPPPPPTSERPRFDAPVEWTSSVTCMISASVMAWSATGFIGSGLSPRWVPLQVMTV